MSRGITAQLFTLTKVSGFGPPKPRYFTKPLAFSAAIFGDSNFFGPSGVGSGRVRLGGVG